MVNETVPKDILDKISGWNFAKATILSYGAISITVAATAILSAHATRTGFIIVNNSTQTVYLGAVGVTIANGLPLEAGASYSNQDWTGAFYGIVKAGSANIRVEEFY